MSDSFWTDAQRRKLHPRRSSGVQLQPRRPAAVLARLREHWSAHCRSLWVESHPERHQETDRIFRLACERLDSATAVPPPDNPETEAAFFALLSVRPHWASSVEEEIVDFWLASRGPAFAVEALAGSLRIHPVQEATEIVTAVFLHQGMQIQQLFGRLRLERTRSSLDRAVKTFADGILGPWARLRRLLAGAGEPEWTLARDVAARLREEADLVERIALAFLFPDVPAWAEEDARAVLVQGSTGIAAGCLLASVRDGDLLERLVRLLCSSYLNIPWLEDEHQEGDVAGFSLAMVEGAGPAAVPALAVLLAKCWSAPQRRDCAEALALVPDERVIAVLVARGQLKEAADAAQRFPRQGIPGLAAEVTRGSKEGKACGPVLARLVRQNPSLARELLPGMDPAARRAVEAELGRAVMTEDEAPPEALPAVLVRPPWTVKAKPKPEPELRLEPVPLPEETAWKEGQREEWLAAWIDGEAFGRTDKGALNLLGLSALAPYVANEDVRHGIQELRWCATYLRASALALMSEGLALALWEELPPTAWSLPRGDGFERFVAKYELRILPGLIGLAEAKPAQGLRFLLPFRSPRIPRIAAAALATKAARPAAQRWLRSHAAYAALALVSPAVGAAGKEREDARAALRFLAGEGEEPAILEAASRHGGEARAAVSGMLAADPLQLFPAKLPKMPDFWQPSAYTRPLLRDRRLTLPLSAVEHLGTMLAFSRMDDPYAGLAQVREACDPDTLGAFAWDLFQSWLDARAPARESWAFQSLAILGGDEQVRRLVPKIREWPAQSAFPRAVAGLDILASLGSDVALMHLHGIAQKAKQKSLQERAAEKLEELAERRGLTAEELADRLVPDLGLGADGSRVLDFGPRSFRIGFDEHLRPFVRDAEGRRLADLPKPGKGDDADKAAQAQEVWKALKKDVKALAALQILRLELAMAGRRRWEPEVFHLFLARHPLVQHLVRRLIWGAYDATGGLLGTFRVAEDASLADTADDPWQLPAGVSVGVAHPLDMEAGLLQRWAEVLADYEVLQPFPQLGREVYRIVEEEQGARKLRRFEGSEVSTGKVLKLVDQRGWRRGPAEDGGFIWYVEKPLPSCKHLARLDLQPGISVGSPMEHPEQTLGSVVLNRPGSWVDRGALPFGELDPVAFSELVRDLEMLRT